jgi:hypothetical protein
MKSLPTIISTSTTKITTNQQSLIAGGHQSQQYKYKKQMENKIWKKNESSTELVTSNFYNGL